MTGGRVWDRKVAVTAAGVLTVGSVAGFVVVYALTVRTGPGRRFGDASLRGALVTNSRFVDAVDAVLGAVSIGTLLGGVAAIALIALLRLRRVPGVAAVGLVVAANASTWLLKTHLLTRPNLGLIEITPATHNSLPSGHTTAVFSVVIALLIVIPARGRRPLAITGGAGAVAVALATMSAGWHRAGDSIAAFLVVGVWAGIAGIISSLAASRPPARTPAPRLGRQSTRMLTVTFGTAALGLCLALGLVLIPGLRTSTFGAVSAFLVGAILIVAAAIAVLMAELFVLERTDP